MLWAAFAVAPERAHAFTEPRSYFDDAQNGGGGGRWFTGSPAEGYGCGVCHTGHGPEELTIEGLPEDGYVPGQQYDIRIAWPDFARRAAEIREQGDEPASMGLIVELVTETGIGSGAVQVAAAVDADEGELCVLPAGEHAAQLFRVRPGEETVQETLARCEAGTLGRRCIVAVVSCGAEELQFTWTAPSEWQGPIWFSAGFVATEEVSGDPSDDAVTEVLRPLLPAASMADHYESRLSGGCHATTPGLPGAGAGAGVLTLLLLLVWRRLGRTEGRP
ncbi:MAG: hypothetical protein OXT09_23800 [Myxococcales bacterium]|nr:hypothetical protein [Myxococcales bacterium]